MNNDYPQYQLLHTKIHIFQRPPRIGVIAHGKLVAQGTLEDLRSGEVGASLEELFLELTDDGGEDA